MNVIISNNENVARLLSRGWVKNGAILHMAFTLRPKETYISVNRPSVSSYEDDVRNFVESHPDFYADENQTKYSRALLNVGEIRNSKIIFLGTELNVNVEVEPRDVFTKSHAGIFTRHKNTNIKAGDTLYIESLCDEVAADEVLLEVRSRLIDISELEYCRL